MPKRQKLHLPCNRHMSKDISAKRAALTIYKERSESTLKGSNGKAHSPDGPSIFSLEFVERAYETKKRGGFIQ